MFVDLPILVSIRNHTKPFYLSHEDTKKMCIYNSATRQLSMPLRGYSKSLAVFNLAKLVTNHQPEYKSNLSATVLTD